MQVSTEQFNTMFVEVLKTQIATQAQDAAFARTKEILLSKHVEELEQQIEQMKEQEQKSVSDAVEQKHQDMQRDYDRLQLAHKQLQANYNAVVEDKQRLETENAVLHRQVGNGKGSNTKRKVKSTNGATNTNTAQA